LGDRAAGEITALGLDVRMLRRSSKWKTGTAAVELDGDGQPAFRIPRPAAYDDLCLTPADLRSLRSLEPSWFYYGTLFPSNPEGAETLKQLLNAMPDATRFYDVNLRPGFSSLELVTDLLAAANVVKLNQSEAETLGGFLGLPNGPE